MHEIIRRFKTDEEDFADLDFHHNYLVNNTTEDLENCVNVIEAIAKVLEAELRQNT